MESEIDGRRQLMLGAPRGDRAATLHLSPDGGTETMIDAAIAGGAWRLHSSAQVDGSIDIKLPCLVNVHGDTVTQTAKGGTPLRSSPPTGRRVGV